MSDRHLHRLGVICGFAAGAWLGAAEAPTKLVNTGFSPFLISLGMVAGVFVARWTLPMALKGMGFVLLDLRHKPHLIVWAVLAGALWAVANTLTVFAIRDVGLSVAFPLWNTNSLIGLLWGWLLFGELRGAGRKQTTRVLGGAAAIALGACMLAYTTASAPVATERAATGIAAALGAGLLWGTMYIPYRKAYISGLNPLSFVTIFTVGELGTVLLLAITYEGGVRRLAAGIGHARPGLFWLFLGGFCWVIGDLFQQYAAKYIGIGRGIPLSNTNQLWGLAWGALVFGETSGERTLPIVTGSLVMAAGAWAISLAEAPHDEKDAWSKAAERERLRYSFDPGLLGAGGDRTRRSWWEAAIVTIAAGIFVWLAWNVRRPPIAINLIWAGVIIAASIGLLGVAGVMLWRRTRFG